MSSVDDRIVDMQFNNSQFENGVKQTLGSLDSLKKGLNLSGAAKGLDQVGAAGSRLGLDKVAAGVQGIADKFKTLSVIGITALANLTNKAVNAGLQFAKSFTTGPMIDGFNEYETKLGSIQTILANTSRYGTKLPEVNAVLNDLNHYADKTIYNFGEMTKNIGLFTNAGIKVKDAASMIKGFSNEAAASGTNAQGAASAAYQLSQALSAGTIRLMDWRSLQNVGMGNKNMQQGLIDLAKSMGTIEKHGTSASAIQKDFNGSLQKGWLSSKVMSNYLKIMAGDMSVAQQKQLGLTDAQIKGFAKQQKMAEDAATKVRTLTQLVGTIREAVGSGWGQTFEILFGNFNQATDLFTNVNNVVSGFVNASSNARNKVLGDWKKLGGRTVLIKGIGNAFEALLSVIKPIHQAFTDIIPAATGKKLYDLTVKFADFMKSLKLSDSSAYDLWRTFRGVFAALDIGWQIIKQVAGVIADLFGQITSGSGTLLDFTGNIGDWLVKLDEAIKKGDGLSNFFQGLGHVLAVPIQALKLLGSFLVGALKGFDPSSLNALSGAFGNFQTRLSPFAALGDTIAKVWGRIGDIFKSVWHIFEPMAQQFGSAFGQLGQIISDGLQPEDFNAMFDVINAGMITGIAVMVKKILGALTKNKSELGGGLKDLIKGIFGEVTNTLQTMQSTLKATTLLEIAAAIGLLTISIMGLSTVNSAGLTKSLTAITVMFGQLLGTMAVIDKVSSSTGFLKLPIIAAGLILFAGAIDLLVIAVKEMAGLSWNDLIKGLTGVSVLLAGLVGATKAMNTQGPKMVTTGLGLLILAAGIKVLADAVTQLSGLSWGEMAKGLVGVGTLLGSLALFTRLSGVGKTGIAQGAGLLILAAGIKVLASALKDISGLSWGELSKGLVGMAGGLALMGAALKLVPPSSILSAAAILVVAASLGMIADALGQMGQMSWEEIAKGMVAMAGSLALLAAALIVMEAGLPGAAALVVASAALLILANALGQMGDMSWEEIGKGLVTLAGSLLILAAALAAMEGSLPGAAALIVAAGALAILAPVLTTFGNMSWEEIGKGLAMLAGALTVLGVAGALMTPVIPTLIGLGVAITLLGGGMALAGAGLLMFSAGLTGLAAAGAAGTAAVVALVSGLVGLIPYILKQLAIGIIQFAKVISTGGPAFVSAMVTVLNSLITAIQKVGPRIIATLVGLLDMLLRTLANHVPSMVDSGMRIIEGFLRGIRDHIGEIAGLTAQIIANFINGIANHIGSIVTAATNLIVRFLSALGSNMGRIADAGAQLVISFVNGVASSIRNNSGAMGAAGANLGMAIVQGMAGAISGGASAVISSAVSMAGSALAAVKSKLGIHSPSREFYAVGRYVTQGFSDGIRQGTRKDLASAVQAMNNKLVDAMRSSQSSVTSLTARLNSLNKAKKKDHAAIRATQRALSQARSELSRFTNAHTLLLKGLLDERRAMGHLDDAYASWTAKVKKAQDNLKAATKTRDDFQKSTRDQYNDVPDISGETTLNQFKTDLSKKLNDTKLFAKELAKLRSMGLNDTLYKQLLDKGTDALPFMSQLMDSGKNGIKSLDSLSSQLDSAASSLGTDASRALYQAGVNAAAGIVRGLQKHQGAVEAQIKKLANSMVSQLKRTLQIHSPSRVFAELGKFTNLGLAKGLDQYSNVVESSASGVGETAIVSMRNALSKISDTVATDIDSQPSIRPVLDLSAIKKDASQIGGMISGQKLGVTATYAKASSMMTEAAANKANTETTPAAASNNVTNYNQTINSPKPVNKVEVYRQTKNLLSVKTRKEP